MRAYYFTSEEFALSNISNSRIKISLLDDLNDPYEFLGVDISDREFREAFKAGRDEAANTAGVICFSRSWKNPLMWSHYGDKHKGICLGIDIDDQHIIEVQYLPKLMKPDVDMKKRFGGLKESFVKNIFSIKYEGWKHEEEVRILVPLNEKDSSGHYFMYFENNMELKEVILGPRATASVTSIKALLNSYKSSVHVLRSRIAFTKYEVVRKKNVADYVHSA